MFAFCCDHPKETEKPTLTENDHLNPIYRRLNNKHSRQHSHHHPKEPSSQPVTLIQATNNIPMKEKVNLNQSVLAKSIMISQQHSIKNPKSANTWHSRQRDHEVNHFNFNRTAELEQRDLKLKQRYISVLQKNNHLLQMQLLKVKNKQLKSSKLTQQLLQLRERLNKVDLSRIYKISGVTATTNGLGRSQAHSGIKTDRL